MGNAVSGLRKPKVPGGLAVLLEGTTLDDIRARQSITVLKDDETVEEALQELANRRVLSAPVRLSSPPAPADGSGATIFGFVDVRDIVSSFFQELEGVDLKPMKMLQRMRILEERGQVFAERALRDLPIIGGDGDFYHLEQGSISLKEVVVHGLLAPAIREEASAAAAAARSSVDGGGGGAPQRERSSASASGGGGGASLARSVSEASAASGGGASSSRLAPTRLPSTSKQQKGGRHVPVVHRLALFDDSEEIVNVISQTDIVKFLDINRSELGPLAKKTVQQLGWCPKPVVSVTPDVSAIEAMALMHEKHISAVAVVDSVGKIIGNFSVSEMRTIMAEHFGALALPVGEFLALEHGTEFVGYRRITDDGVKSTPGHKFVTDRVARTRPRTPGEEVGQTLVLVKPSTSFAEVVEKIVTHRIHRVYVIDGDEKPVGCATCTDVLRVVIAEVVAAAAAASS
ncbi:hypothetical protein Rsub_10519 [Raphidocelis subcapitata]|uniref:CBS domain-containing protein n=1 Tax=Raphidocelis subcapitata TaxID=307507 RepID=A0A2V0PI71_9CHLO|nr:hypothetical protein Rsub_10519 [Raphidocelis subcapitata]|eukprot:GBF97643.1 hypothetical protein Rsub_10519 [Raphidocelis subcapitata]